MSNNKRSKPATPLDDGSLDDGMITMQGVDPVEGLPEGATVADLLAVVESLAIDGNELLDRKPSEVLAGHLSWLSNLVAELSTSIGADDPAEKERNATAQNARMAHAALVGIETNALAIDRYGVIRKWFNQGIAVGRRIEQIDAQRRHADQVRGSKACSRGGSKGAAVTNEAHAELHGQYQANVDKLMGTGMSYTKATEEVATMEGVSSRTVRRDTENKNPRHGSRHKKRE